MTEEEIQQQEEEDIVKYQETLQVKGTNTNEPPHDKTSKMACAPSEDSDQPGHPRSLIESSLSA